MRYVEAGNPHHSLLECFVCCDGPYQILGVRVGIQNRLLMVLQRPMCMRRAQVWSLGRDVRRADPVRERRRHVVNRGVGVREIVHRVCIAFQRALPKSVLWKVC